MNIVLVDDEWIILTWLKKKIEGLSLDYQVVCSCANGKQALEYCLNNPVDLLFTDIRMPLMDGIALLTELKMQKKMPYTVILSAYDDFSYAKEALKVGAQEYLVKAEISEQSLAECMALASKQIQTKATPKQDPLARLLTQFVHEEMLDDTESWQSIWHLNGYCGVSILLVQADSVQHLRQCQEHFRDSYIEQQQKLIVIPMEQFGMAIFSSTMHDTSQFFAHCKQTLRSFGIDGCYLAFASSECAEDLEAVWRSAKGGLRYQQYYKTNVDSTYTPALKQLIGEIEAEISKLIEIDEYPQAYTQIETWLQLIATARPPIARITRVAVRFLLQFYWDKFTEEQRKATSIEDVVAIVHAQSFESFASQLLTLVQGLMASLPEGSCKQYSPAVTQVILFLKEQYASPISLQDIAKQVHLNRTYLSGLFKKEVGVNLTEYLQQLRIQEAKKLLVQKQYSIQQVCEQVGIADSAYFSKMFKRSEKITPIEYRKQNS